MSKLPTLYTTSNYEQNDYYFQTKSCLSKDTDHLIQSSVAIQPLEKAHTHTHTIHLGITVLTHGLLCLKFLRYSISSPTSMQSTILVSRRNNDDSSHRTSFSREPTREHAPLLQFLVEKSSCSREIVPPNPLRSSSLTPAVGRPDPHPKTQPHRCLVCFQMCLSQASNSGAEKLSQQKLADPHKW